MNRTSRVASIKTQLILAGLAGNIYHAQAPWATESATARSSRW
jgi:hypothetical protein